MAVVIKEKQEGRERYAEPFAALDPRCFGGDHRNAAAKDRVSLIAPGDKKGEDDQ